MQDDFTYLEKRHDFWDHVSQRAFESSDELASEGRDSEADAYWREGALCALDAHAIRGELIA